MLKETLKISPEEKQALANSELANLKQEIEHHKNELSHLKEKYQEVKHEKQEIRQEISKQEELVRKFKALIAQLNARKVEANEIINGLKARHKELKTDFLELQNNKADLDRRVLEIEQKNPNLSSLEELQSGIEKLISEKQSLTRQTADLSSQVEDLERANAIMDKLGHPFAHRVYQAITGYVVNYPGVVEGNKKAFNSALADQFGQKLLPKLRGLMLDECNEELNEFSRLIEEIGDEALIEAFATAKDGHFGQFHWRGFVYLEESENLVAVGG